MIINTQSNTFSQVTSILAENLGVQKQLLPGGEVIPVSSRLGQGTVKVLEFSHDLHLSCWHLHLKEDLFIHLKANDQPFLRLLFCKEGNCSFSQDNRSWSQLSALNAALLTGSGGENQIFRWCKSRPLVLYLIESNQSSHLFRSCNKGQLEQLIFSQSPNVYQAIYSQAVSEILRDIKQAERMPGAVRHTFLESKVLELLALFMQQFLYDRNPPQNHIALAKPDVEKLVLAHRYITEHYADAPSIPELSRIVGLNEFKLKKGYKQLFRTTIYEHIRRERMYQARIFIELGNWDIGEIVRRVGYTNKSHFSARFEERYGLKPKEYQQLSFRSDPFSEEKSYQV